VPDLQRWVVISPTNFPPALVTATVNATATDLAATDLQPSHPLHQLATFELAAYRENLKRALALDTLPPDLPPRNVLEGRLAAAEAEEADRRRHVRM
jgi:hypothetical protein